MGKYNKKLNKIIVIILSFTLTVPVLFGCYFVSKYKSSSVTDSGVNFDSNVSLRKFPYPFKASLAIASDIDDTYTLEEFLEIQEFLNTDNENSLGKGVKLDIGNSFHMYETGNIAYFTSDPVTVEVIKEFIKTGVVDFIHSFGQKEGFVREDAVRSIEELEKNNLKVDVWVNHTKTNYNIGGSSTYGYGDDPGSKYYHTDLTIPYGIKFVWLGRVTMVAGQSAEITTKSFTNIFDPEHPWHTVVNIGKEFSKGILSQFDHKKYLMHKNNEIVNVATLKDGQKVYEFMRYESHWQGVGAGADSQGLSYSISKKNLDRLKDASGYMIVYTHFGGHNSSSEYLPPKTISALRNLSDEYYAGNINVTTTSRLLNYYVNRKYLKWYQKTGDEGIVIKIDSVDDPVFGSFVPTVSDLQGITFYVADSSRAQLFIGNDEVVELQRNPRDHQGKESVTIPQRRLVYPYHAIKVANAKSF